MTVATADEDGDADNCGNDDTEKDAVDDDDDEEEDEEHATDKNADDDDDDGDGEEEEEENTDENAGDEPDGEDLTTLPLGTELTSNNLTIWRKWSSMIKMITVDNDCRDD